ncbi:tumor necrosis factor receptor superfamily member 1A isoform X2 [Dunckerocampus dactyliophorus]|uniref:tumor necrosis factor receptor superfamily member 1A isoform X2 n=1 Tax=Dunckerocampus dactyliophorus TaxID=161453 RepID=UPI002405E1A1|nr:tumor necrosis factor receptor superfamily member 1A isoform X2 [Dunckerocampus dactyliophorus]
MIFLLMALLPIGQSDTDLLYTSINSCYMECPPGYHKEGNCNDPISKNRCKKCESPTFTAESNSLDECLRCDTCGSYEVEIQQCTFNSNVVCDCMDGYYNAGSSESLHCLACHCENCKDSQNISSEDRKCEACFREQCLKDAQCKMKCLTTSATTTFTTETMRPKSYRPSQNEVSPNAGSYVQWMTIMLVVVLCWLVVLCICFACYPCSPPSCRNKNPDKDNACSNETHSHPNSDSNMLKINISDENTMMTSVAPVHLDHMATSLPDKVSRQEKPCEHWPPIVLYAIIKEVPPRRWKEFLRLLSVADQQLERVELEVGLGLLERQYQILLLWSQDSSSSLERVFSALHYMDLSGSAQMLQKNLEKLQWRNQPNDASSTC